MFFEQLRDQWRVAVISAHPDDETLGAGGTLARHSDAGSQIYVCVVTEAYEPDWPKDGLRLIKEQAQEAFEIIGVTDAEFLGFPTVKLNTVPNKELTDKIQEFVDKVKPDIIYSPYPGDLNTDHNIVARATAVAARPIRGRKTSLFYYEVLSSTEWGRIYLNQCFNPNFYMDVSETIERKSKAAGVFELELREFPHPRSKEGIITLARMRGMEVGLEMAEAFQLALHIS